MADPDAPEWTRHAIYWRPDPGPLADFGAAWLGWEPRDGATPPPPPDAPAARDGWTATPRKYGLHGTLKAPFRLAAGTSGAALGAAAAALAADAAPVVLPEGLRLARLGGFLALVPAGPAQALGALAARVVADLDRFRAPLTEAERARRHPERLDAAERANLERWGYPHVMEAFRFHITLTGALDPAAAAAAEADLGPRVAPFVGRPFAIGAIWHCAEAPDGRFHDIARHALWGGGA